MKILVTGSAGFVGKSLYRRFVREGHDVYGISRRASETTTHPLDLSADSARDAIAAINPDSVVHCAGLTSVDYCELNKEDARKNNVLPTMAVASFCRDFGKKLVYISTDYVYPGEKNGYSEKSDTQPINYYGEVKLKSEDITSSMENHCILRPTVVFGYDFGGKNFLMQMLALKKNEAVMRVPVDQVSNPTYLKTLEDYVAGSVSQDLRGAYIATGPETIGRYDFAIMAADVFGIDRQRIIGIKTEELNQAAKRPLNNGTDSSAIQKILNYKPASLREALEEIKSKEGL